MYMDDIKLFVKNEKELENIIQAAGFYGEDIGMEFGIEICAKIIINGEKKQLPKCRLKKKKF